MMKFEIALVSRIELRSKVKKIYQLIDKSSNWREVKPRKDDASGNKIEFQKMMEEIAQLFHLEKIFENLSKRICRVTIIPDDSLHGLPFSLLKINQQYLIERYALTIAYENSPSSRKKKIPNKLRKDVLLLGVDSFFKYKPLNGVHSELKSIKAISRIFSGRTHLCYNEDGSRNVFIEKVSSAAICHIATHGIFSHNQPNKTGIVVWNDEIITLQDIVEKVDGDGLVHVTLSSCFGADNFILPGRFVISLPETFWRKGIQSILGCLWGVDDDFVVQFMGHFYKELKKEPRDVALQKTQIAAINNRFGKGTSSQNIFLWAGFQLYGSWKPIPKDLLTIERSHA